MENSKNPTATHLPQSSSSSHKGNHRDDGNNDSPSADVKTQQTAENQEKRFYGDDENNDFNENHLATHLKPPAISSQTDGSNHLSAINGHTDTTSHRRKSHNLRRHHDRSSRAA